MKKILLILFITLPGLLLLAGCFGTKGPQAVTVTEQIDPAQAYTLGNSLENGWEVAVPAGAFAGPVELTVKILNEETGRAFEADDFDFVLPPVSFEVTGQENVRLLQPVQLKLLLPKDRIADLDEEELFYGYFYDGGWQYYIPDQVDLETGTVTFDIYHFSSYGFGIPSETDQIETFAQRMAVDQYNRSRLSAELKKMTESQLKELLRATGADEAVTNQMTADVLSYLEDRFVESNGVAPIDALAQMANAASQGEAGKQAFQNKLLEYTAKGLMQTLEKDPEKSMLTPANVGKLYNVVGNLSTAAGAMSEGDHRAALSAVADLLKNYHPAVALTDSALKFIGQQAQNAIDAFAENELEKAYEIYSGKSADKYGIMAGDFDLIWNSLGGGQREYEMKMLKQYAEKYGYGSYDQIPERMRDKIVEDAKAALKTYFDDRMVYEPEMAQRVKQEQAFIAELKAAGLLGSTSNRVYFGIDQRGTNYDVETRLQRLYTIRDKMRGMIAPAALASLSDKALVSCISQWIYWNEQGDLKGFYQYMRDMGYMAGGKEMPEDASETPEGTQTTETTEETANAGGDHAWVLVETINEDAKADIEHTNSGGYYKATASAAPGSYTFSSHYIGESDTYPDPDQISGEGYGMKLDISVPPSVIQAGETVVLDFNLAFTEQNISYFDGNGGCRADFGDIRFENEAGKTYFEIYCSVKYSDKNQLSVSDTIKAVAPGGSEVGETIELWTGGPSGNIGTRYIYEWQPQ